MTTSINSDVHAFLESYGQNVADLAEKFRQLIKYRVPGIEEQIDIPAKIIGYGFGSRYADTICVLIPSKKGLKMGFYKGSELSDPTGLLTGTGKVHKHIELKNDTNENDVSELLQHAFSAYLNRKK